MIVTCERCSTRFQLDVSRLPESGARVRCSQCKHAFVVRPPGGSPEDGIHRAASEALDGGATPDVTQDLPSESIAISGDDDESAWEFTDDGADAQLGAPRKAARGSAVERRAAAVDPDAAEDLGSPVDWDIFDELAPPASRTAPPVLKQSSAAAPALEFDADAGAHGEWPAWQRRAANGAGWLATAGLCAFALLRGLAPVPALPAPIADPAPGVALEQVRGRWLENEWVGRIYVVSGRLRNTAPALAALPPLVLELRDASGAAIGEPLPLREPSPPERLREGTVADLAAASPLSRPLASGETRDFEIVGWPLPAPAVRFAIRVR